MRNKEIKTIFIDWNGTLSTSKFFEHLETDNQNLYQSIQDVMFGGELIELLNPWMIGELTSEDVIKRVSEHIAHPYEELMNDFIDSCKNMQIPKEIYDLVKIIRGNGTKVVIATDNMDSFDRWTVPEMNLNNHFDAILNSYTLKARKKDFSENGISLFFHDFMLKNKLLPEETMLIDDSEDKENRISDYGINYKRIAFGTGLNNTLRVVLKGIV